MRVRAGSLLPSGFAGVVVRRRRCYPAQMLVLLSSLIFTPALAGSEALDALEGWQERTWGSAPSAELVAVGRDDELVYYGLEGPQTFGPLDVTSVVLGYADDQLVAFRFEVEKGLSKSMKAEFGKASRRGVGEKYWIGERVKLAVNGPGATFTYTEQLGSGATLAGVMSDAVEGGATEQGSLDYLDTRPGWRDLAWGSQPADGMERVDGETGDEAYFIRETDKLAAGEYPLSTIGYGYYKGQLFSVMLMIPDYDSVRGIRSGLQDAYGAPSSEAGDVSTWSGERIELSLSYDADEDQGVAIYFYTAVREELEAAEAAAAAAAADDL